MKCRLYQDKKRSRMSTETRKQVENNIRNLIGLSFVVGPKKAIEIMESARQSADEAVKPESAEEKI